MIHFFLIGIGDNGQTTSTWILTRWIDALRIFGDGSWNITAFNEHDSDTLVMSNKEAYLARGLQKYLIMGILVCTLLIWMFVCLSGWIYEGPRRLIVKVCKKFRSNTKL